MMGRFFTTMFVNKAVFKMIPLMTKFQCFQFSKFVPLTFVDKNGKKIKVEAKIGDNLL